MFEFSGNFCYGGVIMNRNEVVSFTNYYICIFVQLTNIVPIVLATEGEELQGVTLQATQRLKQALTNEREAKSRAQAELELAKV